ncbi:MAG: glycosyltransferase [Methylovulum sp.]|nr:glycosyltransferase [Methylovulum sp.]
MKILFATTHYYLPQNAGGSESLTHDLCLSLKDKGIDCGVLADLSAAKDLIWLKNRIKNKLSGQACPADYGFGYPVYRGWDPVNGVKEVCASFRPDIAVALAGKPLLLADAFLHNSIKTVVYLQDVDFHRHGGEYKAHPLLHYLANSQFTADAFQKAFGFEVKVIPPLVRTERYTVTSKRQKVVFVCPSPLKGVEIAFKLAEANPDIPFLFVESWFIPPEEKQGYLSRASHCPNIGWLPRQRDMRPIYAQAKIMLVPSVCNEAWGRVVTESQASGIPTLASHRGGLPESVGDGGILLDPDADIDVWQRALNSLWRDDGLYNRYSQAAAAYASRQGIQPHYLATELIGFLHSI